MAFGHLPLQRVHLGLEHQVNRFMGCDYNIELAIKRLKSLLDIDRLRAREHSALAELY
jgi:hypothetical protein